ncbi:GNAT family N-acetyltransferase [Conexibacter woesei]|uniref:GCN5-related N-acetyltransferase n=1 Tax=Conexibacter woesei (strain DSM 14684 / CCUG 47730 / CIP 108061 / JCM 11494 / NBRC 100937 / ID131577) TaxID=469383 RepID=D3FDI9_CONWI|nr:GNAT family protein [Conexibacter woesei]ADB49563.1 GCN5-related N-acetyltransferase [Conexibacter woesei DSM 14684]
MADPLRGELVTLRVAGERDVAALLAIVSEPVVAQRWGEHDEERVREDLIGDDACFAIVADGEVVGWIGADEEDDPDYRHVGIDLFLTARLHSRGLGRDAIRALVRHYADRGHHRFTIDPAADNEPAIRAYTAVGFKPVGRMRAYERAPDGSWHDGLLMDLLIDELVE